MTDSRDLRSPIDSPLEWGGAIWELRLDAEIPGLYCLSGGPASGQGPLLGLEALMAKGRRTAPAFSHATLVHSELRGPRIEAVYMPLGWHALQVNAAWTPGEGATIDLDLELQARSVDRLHGLELIVLSQLAGPLNPGMHRSVTPRDTRSAGFTYDGRETNLAGLVTGPPGETAAPWLAPRAGREGWTYLEMVHPDDLSRQILEGTLPFRAARHALLGHDLEKGVVLRARMRGHWLRKEEAHSRIDTLWREFLDRPLHLTT